MVRNNHRLFLILALLYSLEVRDFQDPEALYRMQSRTTIRIDTDVGNYFCKQIIY